MNQDGTKTAIQHAGISLRIPTIDDGMKVYQLIASCPPLDTNSSYCNFLQCIHFSGTSVAAEKDGELVGFISGYIPAQKPDTLFIWQVAVSEKSRGCGLASAMLRFIVNNQEPKLSHLETTITEDNQASWALFRGFAKQLGTDLEHSLFIDKATHFDNQHDSEMLVRIGPITPR